MSKIALIVELDVAPARLDEYMPLLQIHRTRCLKGSSRLTNAAYPADHFAQ